MVDNIIRHPVEYTHTPLLAPPLVPGYVYAGHNEIENREVKETTDAPNVFLINELAKIIQFLYFKK